MKIAASCQKEETTEISGMVDNNETLSEIALFGDGGGHIPPCLMHYTGQCPTTRPTVHIDAAQDFVSVLEKCM